METATVSGRDPNHTGDTDAAQRGERIETKTPVQGMILLHGSAATYFGDGQRGNGVKKCSILGEPGMKAKRGEGPCVVCNPAKAAPGQYCETHREEVHQLDHRYETYFRLQRLYRGQSHESYEVFLRGECEPSARILVSETDPDNLSITIVLTGNVELDSPIPDYALMNISKTYGDLLRARVHLEIVNSWYGNARACVDIFRARSSQPVHWDLDARSERDEEGPEPHPAIGGKHSVH